MTTRQAAYSQAKPPANAVRADGFLRVSRAGGGEAAAALQSEHDFQRRKNDTVGADEKNGNGLHEPPSMTYFFKKAIVRPQKLIAFGSICST